MRKVLSYSVRIVDFNEENLEDLKEESRLLFKSCSLFDLKITPSMWTVYNAVPFHASLCLEQYGFGLGCNTMEGREQMHQKLSKYAENTTYQNRWPVVFRHEFIQLIYLRENGFDNIHYRKRGVKYIPPCDEDCCTRCCMKLLAGKCKMCDSCYMQQVEAILHNK